MRRLTSALLVVLVSLAASAAPAFAATLDDVGWWWEANPGGSSITPPGVPQVTLPSGTPETPPPPDVPENGIMVARDAEGSYAIGAVRFTLSSSESNPVLELTAVQSEGTPALLACITGSGWSGAHGGRWDSKPLVACDESTGGASVSGVPGEEGTWTFNVAPLVVKAGDAKEVDIVIVPERTGEGPQTPFRVVFGPVTGESLKTTSGADDFSFEPPADFGSSFGGTTDSTTFDSGGTDLDLGTFDAPLDPGPALSEPDLPAEEQGLSPTAPAVRNRTLPVEPAAADDATSRVVGLGVVAVALAAAYVLSQRATPLPRALVPIRSERAAEPAPTRVRTGGLGRFARPRPAEPPRLV